MQKHDHVAHLGLTDEQLKLRNLSPDLVLFANEVMDTLGKLLLVRENISSIYSSVHKLLNSKARAHRHSTEMTQDTTDTTMTEGT